MQFKTNHRDVVTRHCCDKCVREYGLETKSPPDSGELSRLCCLCGHYGIGSTMDCIPGDWLTFVPLKFHGKGKL